MGEGAPTKKLHRHLGLWSVISISVGAMMGSGIFVLPLLAAEIAGPWVALSYIVAGFIVLPAMLSKAELATAMPVSGGTYVYLDRSMGPWMGTIGGLGTWLALCAKTAFALVGLGAYLVIFSNFPPLLFSLGVLVLLAAVNILGAGKASTLQLIIVVGSLCSLLIFAALGLPNANMAHFSPAFPEGAVGILSGAGFVFVSYNGVTKVCSVAEEIIAPERNIPLGMGISLFGVMALYALIATVVTGAVDYTHAHHDVTPIATSAAALFGPTGGLVMAGVAVAGLISMCNAGVLSTARFPFAMSRDGLMPAPLSNVHPRTGTPAYAIAFTGCLLVLLVTVLPVYELAKLASGFTIFIFCVVNLSVVVLRETQPAWYRPSFQSPLYPFTQVAGILGGVGVLLSLGWLPLSGIAVAITLGTLWFFLYGRSRQTRTSALTHLYQADAVARIASPPPKDLVPRVVVPVFGDALASERLIRLASAFADAGKVELVRLEEVPDGMSLAHLAPTDAITERLETQRRSLAEEQHLDITFHDVVTHNAKQALLEHAVESHAEWIVMAWPERRKIRHLLKHPMAWWLDHPPCDLAVYREAKMPVPRFKQILVLVEPGPYDTLVVGVADSLAMANDARLCLLRVLPASATEEDGRDEQAYLEQLGTLVSSDIKSRVVYGDDEVATVLTQADAADLLILGAPAERGWRALFVGSNEDRIVREAACAVLRLKAPQDQVHHRMPERANVPLADFALEPYLENGGLHARVPVTSKRDLLRHMAKTLNLDWDGVDEEGMHTALQNRETRQNSGLVGGIGLSAPVIKGLGTTQLAVFTLPEPIDYGPPRRHQVDVVIAVLAPPSQRMDQLWLVDRLHAMVRHTTLVEDLRACQDAASLRAVLEASETAVESLPV